jgi:hypothetical protein
MSNADYARAIAKWMQAESDARDREINLVQRHDRVALMLFNTIVAARTLPQDEALKKMQEIVADVELCGVPFWQATDPNDDFVSAMRELLETSAGVRRG